MTCGCGNENAVHYSARFVKNETGQNVYVESCEKCGDAGNVWLPDVYFDGKPEENLADGPDGKPRSFASKRDKAIYLKSQGICEAGDTFHGAPFTSLVSEDRESRRRRIKQEVVEARRKVQSMSPEYRHNEFMRIMGGR